ncbi:epithelial splicing regulatory protein 1-like isoform X1 [Mizuhopecten yessoensis]|uniref:Epithelial splicing regulatory protein 1 n=2 Tax=Mizuhopecten yessoensis TaxID=6573 RepID=A0A210PZV8_MIZYE|nr:epithelial splicing regulatory protein 1-like isoform X1 [Mizuhopecten yessoensis]OWF42033.1 Epithelial splicing regulatory protein 1 [Mizuhopecten yessoensis]
MAASHLLICFCATAGKNGEDLGVDEQQIVVFVSLLFDVTNCKVVAVQHQYVRPQPTELSETILTEDCKLETGLDEDAIKNSQPLEHVLDEFERFLSAKGVHPENGGKSFCLLTDGQSHLRQCLHPEASNKNVTIPSYFNKFFDLRKQFRKFYKTDNIHNIKSMIDYLGLQEDHSVEYGVRQVQEMAGIVQRLINDGHTFVEPDVINERLEPGICSKSDIVDDNTVVRARGLPWQSSDQDIARFFKGLNIAKGGVALCLSPQGRRNGEALVRFQDGEHRDLALKRHKHHIGQRYIEVYKASGKDFVDVAGGSNTEAQAFLSRGGQVIIRMRGLPFTSTSQQVLEFFAREPNPCTVLDGEDGILFVHYPDGRSTGDAFVLLASEDEASNALKKHREIMGTRYIELFKSTTAEVQQVLNRSMDPRNPEPLETQLPPLIAQIPQQTALPYIPQNMITSGTKRDCVRLRNLPSVAQVTDILNFLGEFSQFIVYQGVHMVYTAQGEPSGEAFIQMDSEEAAQLTTLNRYKKAMIFGQKKRIIDVIQCSGEDMNLVLTSGIGGFPPAMQQATLAPQPHTQLLQRQLISQAIHPAPTMIPTSALTTPSLSYAHLPQPFQTAFPPATMPTMQPRPAYYPPIIYWYPSPPISPQTIVSQTGPCPVVLRGIPFNTSMQDLMNFFGGFPEVTPESIQLQALPDGRPNGEAVVTFVTRGEAERAIIQLNKNTIGNCVIDLFLV